MTFFSMRKQLLSMLGTVSWLRVAQHSHCSRYPSCLARSLTSTATWSARANIRRFVRQESSEEKEPENEFDRESEITKTGRKRKLWEEAGGRRDVYEALKLQRTRKGYVRPSSESPADSLEDHHHGKGGQHDSKNFLLDYNSLLENKAEEKASEATEEVEFETFETLGLSGHLRKALQKMNISSPTAVQCKAIRPILEGRDVIIQSMTGTGKSLSYLLPVLQVSKHVCSTLIIVPTRELAVQLLMVANKLVPSGPRGPFSVALVSGVESPVVAADLRRCVPRVIIGQPKRLLQVIASDPALFSGVRRIVLDEVDRLNPALPPRATTKELQKRIMHPRPALVVLKLFRREILPKDSRLQLICASASMSKWMRAELVSIGFSATAKLALTQERLNIPKSITHQYYVYRSLTMPKARLLVQIFEQSGAEKALVFIHPKARISAFLKDLRVLGMRVVALHDVQADPNSVESVQEFTDEFEKGNIELVVTSNVNARGLDFPFINHVFLLEVPSNPHEYLHLAGRVGRFGRTGTVHVLACAEGHAVTRLQYIYKQLDIFANRIVPEANEEEEEDFDIWVPTSAEEQAKAKKAYLRKMKRKKDKNFSKSIEQYAVPVIDS